MRRVRDLRTMHLGPPALLIVASVEFAPDLDTAGIEDAVARLHKRGDALDDTTNPRLIVIEPATTRRAAPKVA